MRGRWSSSRVLQAVALVLAVVAALVALFAPLYSSSASSCDPGGVACKVLPSTSSSALAVNGAGILGPALAPVLLTLAPLLATGRVWRAVSIICAVLFGMLVLLALLSIGAFYVPALVLAIVAASLRSAPVDSGAARMETAGRGSP